MELKQFIGKFAETLDVEDIDILTAETEFRDLDEWSSLSVILVIAFFDEEFGKEVSDKDVLSCMTISDLYKLSF